MRILVQQLNLRQKWQLAMLCLVLVFAAAAGAVTAILLYWFVSLMTYYQSSSSGNSGQLPHDTPWDGLLELLANSPVDKTAQLAILGALTIACAFLAMIIKILCRRQLVFLTSQMAFCLRNRLYGQILSAQETTFYTITPASAVNRVNNDMYQLQESASAFFVYFFETVWTILLTIIFSLMLSPLLSAIYAAFIPLCIVIVVIADAKAHKHYERNLVILDGVNQVVRESIRGFQIIKSFGLQARQYARFSPLNREWRKTIIKSEFTVNSAVIAMFFVLNVAIIAILYISGYLVADANVNNPITAGVAIAFVNYAINMIYSVYGLTSIIISLVRVKPVVRRTSEFLKTPIEDLTQGINLPDNISKQPLVFEHVSYAYPNNVKTPALSDISFVCAPGKILGIVGPSGAGKSTLVSLIARLAEPTSGHIMWGQNQLAQFQLGALRNAIGYAPQERIAFTGTIASNLRHGKADATEQEMLEAAQHACALDFIEATPDKFEHHVSQYGLNLSGGQRQRLSLARALIRKPTILILDDTLSALDNITRDRVLMNLKAHYQTMTQVIVAQQIRTVKHADWILVLDNGQLVGQGTHETLMQSCPLYQQIAASQNASTEHSDVD